MSDRQHLPPEPCEPPTAAPPKPADARRSVTAASPSPRWENLSVHMGARRLNYEAHLRDLEVVDSDQKANRPGDATNAPGHDTEEVTSMPDQPTTSCNHCFCRSKTVAVDALAIRKTRVRYCCWCGEEKPCR